MPTILKSNAVFLVSNEELENIYTAMCELLGGSRYMARDLFNEVIDDKSTCDVVRDLINICGWNIVYDEVYDITDIKIVGHYLASLTPFLFKAIAPYVVNESYVEVVQSDNLVQRWNFIGKKAKKILFSANDPAYINGNIPAPQPRQRFNYEEIRNALEMPRGDIFFMDYRYGADPNAWIDNVIHVNQEYHRDIFIDAPQRPMDQNQNGVIEAHIDNNIHVVDETLYVGDVPAPVPAPIDNQQYQPGDEYEGLDIADLQIDHRF